MTLRRVAKPLGFTVVTCVEMALRPTEDAEIEVVPGVVLVVKFATAKPVPRGIVTCSETEPTPSWEVVLGRRQCSSGQKEGVPAEGLEGDAAMAG